MDNENQPSDIIKNEVNLDLRVGDKHFVKQPFWRHLATQSVNELTKTKLIQRQ